MGSALTLKAASVIFYSPQAHNGFAYNNCGPFAFRKGIIQGSPDFPRIVTVDRNHIPAPCIILFSGIFCSYSVSICRQLDIVGIIKHDEITQPKVTGNAAYTLRNLFLNTSVGNVCICFMLHVFPKTGGQKPFSYGSA